MSFIAGFTLAVAIAVVLLVVLLRKFWNTF